MMARDRQRRGRSRSVPPLPDGLRPLLGGAVLVASVRAVDVLWHLVTRRPTPLERDAATATSGGSDSEVRDRMVYAALLGGALRVARRAGLPRKDEDAAPEGRNGRSPA